MICVAYVDPTHDGTPRRALKRLIEKAGVSAKAAALEMGEWDFGTASRAMNGLAPLDLNRLWLLSPRLVRKYLYALLRANVDREEREQDEAARREIAS